MTEPIIYTSINEKNLIKKRELHFLSPAEALINALDWMDFMVALTPKSSKKEFDDIEWIELSFKNDQQ